VYNAIDKYYYTSEALWTVVVDRISQSEATDRITFNTELPH